MILTLLLILGMLLLVVAAVGVLSRQEGTSIAEALAEDRMHSVRWQMKTEAAKRDIDSLFER